MKTFGGNSGYRGYSESKRSFLAKENGSYPKTQFKQEYGIPASHFVLLKKIGIIASYEWHHTSMYGNQTAFYSWSEEEDIERYYENKKEIAKLLRSLPSNKRFKDADFTDASVQEDYVKYSLEWSERYKEIKDIVKKMFY